MTDFKRERLLDAAIMLVNRKGFINTSIADIACESGVSIAKVKRYFKTRNEVACAVIHKHLHAFRVLCLQWEKEPDPRQRLMWFLDVADEHHELITRYGYPLAYQCLDIDKKHVEPSDLTDKIVRYQLEWVFRQFNMIDKDNAENKSIQMIAELQGASLLANVMDDSEVFSQQVRMLRTLVMSS